MKVKTLEQKKMKVNPTIQHHQHHISSYNHIYRLNITQYTASAVYTLSVSIKVPYLHPLLSFF